MADILIRGMAMPENCIHCRFAVDGWCYAYGKPNIPALEKAEVSSFCPLVPIPEGHGRLIDADALLERLIKTSRYFDLKFDIDAAPTIVPAEGGGEK
jgi:hypothetical protein